MAGAGRKSEDVRNDGRYQGDAGWPNPQCPVGNDDKVIQTTCRLHGSRRCDNGQDHAEHGPRGRTGREAEEEYQDQQSDAGHSAERDPTQSRAHEYTNEDNQKFQPNHDGAALPSARPIMTFGSRTVLICASESSFFSLQRTSPWTAPESNPGIGR